MAAAQVYVRGLSELVRDFRKLDPALARSVQGEVKDVLEVVASEVRSRASSFAPPLVSVSTRGGRGFVRRTRSKNLRGDFGALLMTRAYLPAMAAKEEEVVRAFDDMLGNLFDDHGF